jgi:hypothetical protein
MVEDRSQIGLKINFGLLCHQIMPTAIALMKLALKFSQFGKLLQNHAGGNGTTT